MCVCVRERERERKERELGRGVQRDKLKSIAILTGNERDSFMWLRVCGSMCVDFVMVGVRGGGGEILV